METNGNGKKVRRTGQVRNYFKCNLSEAVGVFVITVGMACIVGHMLGIEPLYSWNGPVGMALNTAACFIAVGLALMFKK